MAYLNHMATFNNEVKFQVGQRVRFTCFLEWSKEEIKKAKARRQAIITSPDSAWKGGDWMGGSMGKQIALAFCPTGEILCKTGIITQIRCDFPHAPAMRRFRYTVWLDSKFSETYGQNTITFVNANDIEVI